MQHPHGWLSGGLEAVAAGAGEVIRAYQDIGMRVSYSFAFRDQNRLVYHDDKEFTASLPAELQPALQRHFARFGLNLADYGALFEQLVASTTPRSGSRSNWRRPISIGARTRPSSRSPISRRAIEAPMHMHLVETAYQKEYARRRGGGTALDSSTASAFSDRA